ncbi:hypothetical protein GCM10010413_30590 [Promicromonospora sukumoe]|uniref:Amino acid adenylation domain-containing protein/thioester reductase-like protein n=1 Tax=Promicromonospora sukumoe TaxID=88382 RepID=A0A7W3J7R3_9MICO|nr:amino acid adenylation domain-containing protein [Promicromonospora sukumoe]MBA8807811.1 amino acid adenylation domain-containing protein/thioester reductase-like protein [Promicromonospora sukumoe]
MGTYRRQIRTGRQDVTDLAGATVAALAEAARRLNRELDVAPATPGEASGPAGAVRVAVVTRDPEDGVPGPDLSACVDDAGELTVTVCCPPGDPWQHAVAAVAEMHGELLGALLGDPSADLAEVDALSESSRAAVLGPLAGATVDHGPYRSVVERVLAAAERTPDAVAVHAGDGSLTYRELVGRATALGALVRGRVAGTTKGREADRESGEPVLVPVLVADGLALPVAWSAVLLSGAGYVPVDPAWPAERVTNVLDQLGSAVVLCVDPAAVPAGHRDRAVVVEVGGAVPGGAGPDGAAPDDSAVVARPAPGDVVYGVYTSGTTGTPLCAVNVHGGLANRLAFMDRWFGAPAGREVVLQSTRHIFDSAFWQIFWPLTRGGAVVVPTVGARFDLEHTVELIEDHAVTVADFVPAVLHALLAMVRQRPGTLDRLRSLRHVVIGGEQINPRDAHELRELLHGLRASNAYGPTEASIGMIFHEIAADDGDDVPLGRPVDNCAAVIVDVDGRPLPQGATGEIVIGGACVGVGYHGAPDRTAQRFFPSPWGGVAGPGGVLSGRMYRTGDLGYLDADGRFRFVGRIDHQIKIAGVRIEPGEVETLALDCPGVRQAVALVAGPSAHRELVLVLTGHQASVGGSVGDGRPGPANATSVSADAVLAVLRSRLPRGSVPQRVVVVDELPLTEAGKTDRRRLTAQVEAELAVPADDGAGDPVLAVLRTVLRRPHLAADEDVFAAGASSLQAVAVVGALAARLDVEVGVRDLLDHPTAVGLGDLLRRRGAGGDDVPSTAGLMAADLDLLAPAAPEHDGPDPLAEPPRRPDAREPRTVLLTGATGFVGTRLLHELLEGTDLDVLCLVRGDDDEHAGRRLASALRAQGLDEPGHAARTSVVAGDLALPAFGLTGERWHELARRVDLVVHCGALVNLVYDYRVLREPNVLGTAEIIRLARDAGGVPLHHVSTLGALHDHALLSSAPVTEDVDVADVVPPSGGYSASKWVAERLVRAAGRAGHLPVTVLRLGEVMPVPGGTSGGASANPTALTQLLLTAFRRLGEVPDAALRSDHSPVDAVARAVVAAVSDPEAVDAVGRVRSVHLFRPGTVRFDELPGPDGRRYDRVPCLRFVADLRAAAALGDQELGRLLAVLEHRAGARIEQEDALRDVLEGLLQDNPALFDRSRGELLERRAATGRAPVRVPVAAGAHGETYGRG